MDNSTAFLIGTHPDSFRSGEPAEIIGVKMIKPSDGKRMRPCYWIVFKDGVEDFTAISDTANYRILSFGELIAEGINI